MYRRSGISYFPQKHIESPVSIKLVLSDEVPIFQHPSRIPELNQKVVNDQVQEWPKNCITQPSFPKYASPIFLVLKKYGTKR